MGFEDLYGVQIHARRRRRSWKMPCISPHSNWARIWEVVVAAASFSSTMLSVFQVCFDTSIQAFWGFQYFLDFLCLLNICSRFYIGFQSHGVVILDESAIRRRYLQSWFCIDLLSLLPFELIDLAFPEDFGVGQIVTYCRINRLLRILRFFTLISSLSQEPGVNKTCLALVRYSSLLVLLIHSCGCIWYHIVCTPTHYLVNRHCHMNNSWPQLLLLINQDMEKLSISEDYVISIYWAGITTTEVMYGDIHAMNTTEAVISILVMCLGFAVVSGMIMAGMSSLASNGDARRGEYYYRLKSIQKSMNDIGLSKEVRHWVINYYLHLWDHYRGCVVEGLLDDLPFPLYSEITMVCNKGVMDKAEIFQGTGEGFRRTLSTAIHPYSYSAGQVLVRQGQVKQSMYFVEHGLLKVTGTSELDQIATLLPGCLIGEVSLMYGIPQNVTISAATMCEILVLKRKDLLKIFVDYPEAAQKISRLARARCYNVVRPIREAFDVGVASHPKHVIFHKDLGQNLKPQDEKIFKLFMESVARYTLNIPAAIRTLIQYQTNAFWQKTIPPDSVIAQRWEVFVVVCQVLVLFIMTWILLFNNNAESIGLWGAGSRVHLLSIICTVDIIFVADIILRLRIQVPSADGNLSDFRSIFQNYIRSWEIYYDILSVLPFDLFSFLKSGVYDWKIAGLLRVNRFLWIRKLLAFMKRYESDLRKDVVKYLFMKCIFILLFSSHICAGVFYLTGCFHHRCDTGSWAEYSGLVGNESYLFHYMIAVYWATTTLTTTGTGDITAYTFYERLVALLTCIIGIFVYTYITAQISAVQGSATSARVDFQNRLAAITMFMKNHNLQDSLQKRVINYMALLWDRYEGQMDPGSPLLMSDLPWELQKIILMKERGCLLSKVPYFDKIGEDFICELAAVSKTYFYPPGEIIQYHGTIGRELFCIRKGKCQVISADFMHVRATFGAGVYFGETGFLFGVPDTLTVRAKTHCEILVLDYQTIEDVLNKYPIIKTQLEVLQQNTEYCDALMKNANDLVSLSHKSPHLPKTKRHWTTTQKAKPKRDSQCCENERGTSENLLNPNNADPMQEQAGWKFLDFSYDFIFRKRSCSLLMKQAVLQNNRLYRSWEVMRLLLAIAISIICSTQLTFLHISRPLWVISYILGVICWLDMYLHFHVAFYQSGKLVTNTLLTARHYLQTNFLIDLIGCFPWEIIAFIKYVPLNEDRHWYSDDGYLHIYAYCRMPHVLQLYRVHLAFNYWQSDITREKPWLTFLQFFLYNAIFLHICSCLVWISVCDLSFDTEPTNASFITTTSQELCLRTAWSLKLPHVFPIQMENMTLFDFYTLSLYCAIQMVSNVGYGDVYPVTTETMFVATVLMMVGALFYSWMVGTVISIIANADTARVKYTEKLQSIKYFLKKQNIRGATFENTIKFYSYKWMRTGGVEQKTLFDSLPSSLQGDISTVLYADLIAQAFGLNLTKQQNEAEETQTAEEFSPQELTENSDTPIFRKTSSKRSTKRLETNQYFIQMLAKCVRPCLFRAHDVIVKRNDLGEEMFFIHKGEVQVLSPDEQQVLVTLKAGQYFGEWSLMFSEPRSATVRASTNCDLYILEKNDLGDVMKYFPDVYKEIEQTAASKRKRAFEQTNENLAGHEPDTESTNPDSELMRMYREYMSEETAGDFNAAGPSPSAVARLKECVWQWVGHVPETIVKLHNTTADPENKLWTVIQYICSSFTMLSFWSTTYLVALGDMKTTVYVVSEVCEIILIIEIFCKFHIRYYDENGSYVHQYPAVSQHYLQKKLGFVFDMICAFPIATFCLPLKDGADIAESLAFLSKANMLHVLRMVSVCTFVYEEEKSINSSLPLVRLFKCVALLTVYLHVSALLFIHVACPDFCYPDSSQSFIPMFSQSANSGASPDLTVNDIYVNAFYWVFQRLTTSGFGKIQTRWRADLWLTIVVLFVGKFVVGYILGIFSATEANAYALQVSFEEKLQAVKTYMANRKVPSPVQERVVRFYNYLFARSHGVDYSTLFNDTPRCMKSDIFASIGLNLLKKQRLFSNLPESFLQHLCTELKLHSYSMGEYLVQKGDIAATMFLIVNGKVMVSSHTEESGVKTAFLTNGQAYGMAFLFIRGQAQESLQAGNYVTVLTLSKADFENISSKYTEIQDILYNRQQFLFGNRMQDWPTQEGAGQ